MTLWRSIGVCALLLLAIVGERLFEPPAPQEPFAVFIPGDVVRALDSIADTATIEHYRCLLGTRDPDSLVVRDFWEPHILRADYNTVTAGLCPFGTVGSWHNHLPFQIPMSDPHNRQTRVEATSVCELSPADRLTARGARPVNQLSMISVALGVHCAWLRTHASDPAAEDSIIFVRLPWRHAP